MENRKDGFRAARVCEVCEKGMPKRRTDRYATGHARCWKVWKENGMDMAKAKAALAGRL